MLSNTRLREAVPEYFEVLDKLRKGGIDPQPGIVLCMSDALLPYSRGAWYCPIEAL